MSERPNMKDVARAAGVSFKTVSRVVNDASNVSPDIRARVLAAIADLDYIPNTSARSLKTGVGDVVGIVVDNIDDPFFADLVSSIEHSALESGIDVLITSTGLDAQREMQALNRLAGHNVRGIIAAPVARELSKLAVTSMVPIVLVDRQRAGLPAVLVDDIDTSDQAVTRFIERGHRRIAFLGLDQRSETSQRRYEGYQLALQRHGLAIDQQLQPPTGARADSEQQTERLLDLPQPPTAILASHPRAAMRIVEVLHRRARTDIAFISFGDFPMADALDPPVTCVQHDARAIGRRALRLLLDAPAGIKDVFIPVSFLLRGSGELPAP